jgi:hypothetical protein
METINRLHEMLAGLDGKVTRQWINDQIKALKEPPVTGPRLVVDNDEVADPAVGTPWLDTSSPISVLRLTPNNTDIRLMGKPFEDGQPPCRELGARVADDAIMIVEARVGHLMQLMQHLSWWRFERYTRIYLPVAPTAPDIFNVKAVAVCERGKVGAAMRLDKWPDETDGAILVDKLAAGIGGRRVHLFARSNEAGWECVVGDANWKQGER